MQKGLQSLIAAGFGALATLAFSPFDWWGLIYVSYGALVFFVTRQTASLPPIFAWGVGYFFAGVNWLNVSMQQFGGVGTGVSYLFVLLLASYLALYPLAWSYVVVRWRLRSPWVLAALFVIFEQLRGVLFSGFPWLEAGYSQIDSPFAGLAPIGGVGLLTFFVVWASASLVALARAVRVRASRVKMLRGGLVFAGVIALAAASRFVPFVSENTTQPAQRISLVQGNISQQLKWDPAYLNESLRLHQALIESALGKADAVILPESVLPVLEHQLPRYYENLDRQAREAGSALLLGSLYQTPQGEIYNSALQLGNAEAYQAARNPRYLKQHLVPFGEYLPLGALLDYFRSVFILPTNLSAGAPNQAPFIVNGLRYALAICYEIIFADEVRANARAGSDFLLTISNDAWFGESIGPWQHFQIARMRALELGKPLIRATNTGVSAFVEPNGKISAIAPQFTRTMLSHSLKPYQGETPFFRFGQASLYGLIGVILLVHFGQKRVRATREKANANG